MKINSFTNYAYRILIMLAANTEKTVSLTEIATAYDISLNHLKKVSARLVEHGFVVTERGRSGGLRISKPPAEIGLGEVFRIAQTDTAFVECLGDGGEGCVISPVCTLQGIFKSALAEFIAVLDRHTLQDLVNNRDELNTYLGVSAIRVIADEPTA